MNWVRTKSDEAAVDAGCFFDLAAADRVRTFCAKFLRHSKGEWAGKPFELLDWEWTDVIAPLFGWKRPDGTRRFRRAGCGLPKKNGKSTLCAALALYMLIGDKEPGAEVYSAAADRDQASIIYNEAADMAEASPALLDYLKVRRSVRRIWFPKAKGVYRALTAEASTKEGFNIHCLLFDELHTQKTRALWDALYRGGIARRQPLQIWISTAGVDRDSLCYQEWQYAKGIQESKIVDTAYLAYIKETPAEADYTSPEVWAAANPSYGVTLKPEDFADEAQKAAVSTSELNSFLRYRLNVWTGQMRRWLRTDRWATCRRPPIDLTGRRCIVGLDLASTTDLVAAVFMSRADGRYAIEPHFWLPRETLGVRERENRFRLNQWVDAGYITLTDGDVVDYGVVRAALNEHAKRVKIDEVALDPWNATQLACDLQTDGFKVTYVRQGYQSISHAAKEFEKLILAGQIDHDGNPVLDWMIGNVAAEEDANGNIKPSKRRSAEKIDGVCATITALARFLGEQPKKPSRYNKGGEFASVTVGKAASA